MTTFTQTPSKPKRRWLRFSLRTLLVVSVLIGLGCAWVGMQLQQKRRHEAVVKEIERLGGEVYFPNKKLAPPQWKKSLFGAYAVEKSNVSLNETDATDSILARMKGMKCAYLVLSSTKITDDGMAHLQGMASLETLDLSATQITGEGLQHLQGMVNLTDIVVDRTQIIDEGLTHLQAISNLQRLYIVDRKASRQGLDKIKKAIPGCEINFIIRVN